MNLKHHRLVGRLGINAAKSAVVTGNVLLSFYSMTSGAHKSLLAVGEGEGFWSARRND